MKKGHWTTKHPRPGHQLAIVLNHEGWPFVAIVKTGRQNGRCTASVPWSHIVCFWSVQCKLN